VIIVVDDKAGEQSAFAATIKREGVATSVLSADDLECWVTSADEAEVASLQAVLLASCERWDLAGAVKRRSAAAVIAVRENPTLQQKLDLFAAGLDDVVVSGCHAKEILARIGAVIRRGAIEPSCQHVAGVQVFHDGRDPLVGGEPMRLPRRELRVLECFVRNSGKWVSKSRLFNSVYGVFESEIDDTVVESHVSKLRKRLRNRLGYDPIESKRYLGYLFKNF